MVIDAYLEQQKRADQRAGVVAAIIANVNRAKGRRPKKPSDFFPSLKKRSGRRQTPAQQRNVLGAMAQIMGGRVQRVPVDELRAIAAGRDR
jgi:hypothetical protein